MQTKLTLRLEEELIEQAKSYARLSGKSLSQMVADYFVQLHAPAQADDLPPVTSSLKGALKSAVVDERDYRAHLEDKYR
jgi:hypothetical protein